MADSAAVFFGDVVALRAVGVVAAGFDVRGAEGAGGFAGGAEGGEEVWLCEVGGEGEGWSWG